MPLATRSAAIPPHLGGSATTEQRPEHPKTEIRDLCAPHLIDAVTRHDVTYLVAQHSGQLALILGRLDEPAMYVDEAPRQRERIDFGGVDHPKGVSQIGSAGARRELVPKSGHVGADLLVFEQLQVLLHHRGRFAPELDLLLVAETAEQLSGHWGRWEPKRQ